MKRMEIKGRVYDYPTIAQSYERRMNGANVHDLKVDLAVVRSIFMRHDYGYPISEKDKETLAELAK